jgi:hypothetical protein
MTSFKIRFYTKTDINRENNELKEAEKYESISEYEVFTSDCKNIIFIENIISHCIVS